MAQVFRPLSIGAIILAGGDIRHKLQALRVAADSPALLPVNTRPLAAYVTEVYAQAGIPIALFVSAAAETAVRRELALPGAASRINGLPATRGVVESLRHALEQCPDFDDVIVNLITTVPPECPAFGEVFVAEEKESQGALWSGVALEDGAVAFSTKRQPLGRPVQAFTGVFRASRAEILAALGRVQVVDDLMEVVRELHRDWPRTFRTVPWVDCGHETNYFDARVRLINSRAFNRLHVRADSGTVTKRSTETVKLRREAQYAQMLPPELAVYFPRLLRTRFEPDVAGTVEVEMEYYGYPTLAEYQLYWDLGELHWRRLFQRLGAALEAFRRHGSSIGRSAHEQFYLGRTLERLAKFHEGLLGTPWEFLVRSERLRIEGVECMPFAKLQGRLEQRLGDLYRESDFCVMHGDFCFNNILYDLRSGVVRLIDPRGSFGDGFVGIYGDRKYDLAKLLHSASGGYDYLVNDLFRLEGGDGAVAIAFNWRENQPLLDRFATELVTAAGAKLEEIRLLMGLLFLSMGPFHADSRSRQIAMYAHGLRLINESLR